MNALLNRALMTLKAMNAEYKVILPDGTQFGDLEVQVKPERKKKRPCKYPRGTMQNYVREFMKDMAVGDLVEVPVGEFLITEVQTAVCNFSLFEWGKGCLTTAQNAEKNVIEAMRVQ
jgi:hypothetical protein